MVEKTEKVKEILTIREIYENILSILSTYMDLPEDEKKIISLWVIAAGFKECFITFPFLFINASKGSGKTRLLKLLEALIPNSKLTPNLTEAALFRLPSQENLNALLIDEAERLTSKEKGNLRELLNQAYKRGGSVLRVEEDAKRTRIVREYKVFMAIGLANIWGLEPVLEDRCITIILEKSKNPEITKIPEFFDLDERIIDVKRAILVNVVYVGSSISGAGEWVFVCMLTDILSTLPTLHTLHTQPTQPTLLPKIEIAKDFPTSPTFFYEVLKKSSLVGRDLELWLPLLSIAAAINEDFFIEMVNLAQHKCKEKKEEEIMEDRDTIFSTFLFYYIKANGFESMMIAVKVLKDKFIEIEGEKYWLTTEWIGRCMRRLKIVKNKRRIARGVEVEVDVGRLEEYLRRRGIEITDEEFVQYKEQTEDQTTLKDRPDAKDHQEALEKWGE